MTTATEPLSSECPHCAACQSALYRDADGIGCLLCGWHRYDARPAMAVPEPGYYSHELRRWLNAGGEEMAAWPLETLLF